MKLVNRYTNVAYIKGKVLCAMRKQAGLSQQQLSDILLSKTGRLIDQRRISEMEKSYEFPVDADMLRALKKILR